MGLRVVIADDAAFIREVFRNIVAKTGSVVVGEATNGDEAVAMVLREKPDLVIMDIVMPIKSGIQAAKEILSVNPKMKIIACSTEGNESMVYKALDAGCIDYITKPFKMEDVSRVIKKFEELQHG